MQDDRQPISRPTVAASLVPDIVKDIPVATPGAKSQPANEDDELDKIMHDVGQDIRQIGKKKPKRSWFSRLKKTKPEPKFSARPIDQIKPAPSTLTMPLKPIIPAVPAQVAKPPAATTAAPAKLKPPKTSSAPVGAILLALLVTGALSAAAYYAYK